MDYEIFYDTCSLINLQELAFDKPFIISQITLQEIEKIKVSNRKDLDIKYKARRLAHLLNEYDDKYIVVPYNKDVDNYIEEKKIEISPDNIIVASADLYSKTHQMPILFTTDDLNLSFISRKIFNLRTINSSELYDIDQDEYKGYKEVSMSEQEMSYFYSNIDKNIYDLFINQYLLVADENGTIIDNWRWTGETHEKVKFNVFKSNQIGTVKPLDKIQECAMDSIKNNDITVLFGRAGSGKTTLPVYYFMDQLEKGKIKKCYFVYSFEPLKNAKTLGFEKGDHITKLLYSASIGNILASKFGDLLEVQRLLEDGKIDIIPTANLRGVEFEADSCLIVSEVQNIDVYTLKTILQRCKEGCKQIYEGDIIEQTDISISKIGMDRMIEVFRGHPKFGCVKLKNNYRSELGEFADRM